MSLCHNSWGKFEMSDKPEHPQQRTHIHIPKLEGLEPIRLRPGMYVGSTVDGIYCMLDEVIDNAVEVAIAEHCNKIEITLHENGSITVSDNGSGIPIAMIDELNMTMLEVILTQLHQPKRPKKVPYRVKGGLHGVGLRTVNALSTNLTVQVKRDGYLWQQTFSRGHTTSELTKLRTLNAGESTGTSITFAPDAEIFPGLYDDINYKYELIEARCRELGYILQGCTLYLKDERSQNSPNESTFYFESGLRAYVEYLRSHLKRSRKCSKTS
jgi:DNA gyrase subunit B